MSCSALRAVVSCSAVGSGVVGSGFALLQFGIENVGRGALPPLTVLVLLGTAALLLVAFARYARRIRAPAVDLTLFRLRAFGIATLAGGLCRIGFNGVPFFVIAGATVAPKIHVHGDHTHFEGATIDVPDDQLELFYDALPHLLAQVYEAEEEE